MMIQKRNWDQVSFGKTWKNLGEELLETCSLAGGQGVGRILSADSDKIIPVKGQEAALRGWHKSCYDMQAAFH